MLSRLTRRCVAWAMVAVCFGGAMAAGGQPLADRVPGDALIYAGWGGAEAKAAGFAGSHLEGMLKESDIPKLINETVPAFMKKLGAMDPQAAQVTALLSAIGGPMWRHPSAFYFGGVAIVPNGPVVPKFALLCDAGQEGAALAQMLKAIVDNTRPPYPIKVEEAGGFVAVHAGIAGYAAGNKPADALINAAKFKAAQTHVGKDAVLAVYLDVEGTLALVDTLLPPESRQGEMWGKVRDAIGLGGIKRIMATAGFDGKDWMTQAFVDSPAAGRKGVVAQLMSAKPLDPIFLKSIPASSTMLTAGRFDIGGLVKAILAAVDQVEPRASVEIAQGLEQVRQQIGVDIQKDLLDALGDQWALFSNPGAAGNGLLGLTIINMPRDPAKLEASVTKLEDLGNGMLRQMNRGGKGPVIEIKRSTARGVNLHYLAVPIVSPAWAIKDGIWYAGLFPQSVVGAAETAAAGGKSILENPDFVALRKRLGDPKATAISFTNLPKTAPDSYGQVLMLSRLALGAADLFGADTPPLVLPPLDRLMPHLSVAGGAAWIDDDGWHSKAVEPFPGATLLAGGGGEAALAVPAMGASILLPSLNKARETANRVKCASNLRQIGMGCMLYANENKGNLPPDLGSLLAMDLTPEVFECPTSDHGGHGAPLPPPPAGNDPAAMKKWEQQRAAWVNDNSTYVYLGAGLKMNNAGADTVIAYEKEHNHRGEGVNMLYGDGHVEWQFMGRAMEEIERSKQKRAGKAGGL